MQENDPKSVIVILDKRFPISIGGIRLISGVNEDEVTDLAISMNRKLHSFGFPMGGAKAGIDSDSIEDLTKFLSKESTRKLLLGKDGFTFVTGPDIGVSEDLYNQSLIKTGLSHLTRSGLLSSMSLKYKLPFDNIITAFGALVAAEEVFSQINQSDGRDHLNGLRISLEGFGKVGTGLARILNGRSKVVSISTRYGSIYDAEGIDIDLVLKLQEEIGDKFLYHTNYEVSPPEALFSNSTDLIIPGARTRALSSQICNQITKNAKAKAIVPVANAPYTNDGLQILQDGNIICFPDFIASAGAVIAAMVEFGEIGGQDEAFVLVEHAIRQKTKELFDEISDYRMIYDHSLNKAESMSLSVLPQVNASEATDIKLLAHSIVTKYAPFLVK